MPTAHMLEHLADKHHEEDLFAEHVRDEMAAGNIEWDPCSDPRGNKLCVQGSPCEECVLDQMEIEREAAEEAHAERLAEDLADHYLYYDEP